MGPSKTAGIGGGPRWTLGGGWEGGLKSPEQVRERWSHYGGLPPTYWTWFFLNSQTSGAHPLGCQEGASWGEHVNVIFMELMLGSRGYWDGEGVERWPQGFCVRGDGGPESDVWTARKGSRLTLIDVTTRKELGQRALLCSSCPLARETPCTVAPGS